MGEPKYYDLYKPIIKDDKIIKPKFKHFWEKLNEGDYTDIKEYNKAMKCYNYLLTKSTNNYADHKQP